MDTTQNQHMKKENITLILKNALSFPLEIQDRPNSSNILSSFLLVIIPWLIFYESRVLLGIPQEAIDTNLPFEKVWPVLEWTEWFYFSIYFFVGAFPFVSQKKSDLREFMVLGIWSTIIGMTIMHLCPFISPYREFIPQSFLGQILLFERALDSPAAAFPSFHVIWSLVTAHSYTLSFPKWKILWWFIGMMVVISTSTTGMHSIADIIAGCLVFLLTRYRWILWAKVSRFF